MVRFANVVPSVDLLMGVKAVWGRSSESVMCFGGRGDAAAKDKGYFAQARSTAERAISRPYLVTVGGGEQVPTELKGRVLELVRVTGVFGETVAFVRDPTLRARLAQWPVAVVLSEVYAIEGEPRLIEELGFEDRRILANAFDAVRRDDALIGELWKSLSDIEVRRRWDVRPLLGFRDPGKVQMFGSMYPKISPSSTEGKRIREESVKLERDRSLASTVKEDNRRKNGGVIVCEACEFSDTVGALFDAHHLEPLATGIRESRGDDFAVLCPTCHRWAHVKSESTLVPLAVGEIRAARSPLASADAKHERFPAAVS
jgi:hypothetical protein